LSPDRDCDPFEVGGSARDCFVKYAAVAMISQLRDRRWQISWWFTTQMHREARIKSRLELVTPPKTGPIPRGNAKNTVVRFGYRAPERGRGLTAKMTAILLDIGNR